VEAINRKEDIPMPKTKIPADAGEELIDFLIPRTTPEDRPVFLGVNGESVRVAPGEPVRVKRKFAEVYFAALAQERAAFESRRRAREASKKALADL
jgi:hypothetical protein